MRAPLRFFAAVVATLLAAALTVPADGSSLSSVVVLSDDGSDRAAAAVRDAGGQVESHIELVDGVLAEIPSHQLDSLARQSGITVSPNYEMSVADVSYGDVPAATYAESIGATDQWAKGRRGEGVGIALLDTGIADHPDLQGRVVASADLTTEGTFSDSYGHGTFIAGLIAGDGSSSQGRFTGVAPEAHLMSVKVAGADGQTSLGQVLYGLQLIDASKEQYGIKVVTIALASRAVATPDPLVLAVERLWADGLVVVVAAGNEGPSSGSISSPAVDPYVLTVGGTDEQGTSSPDDDTVGPWSGRGPSIYGMAKPDVVAPGASLVSLRAPGTTVDTQNPKARIGESYFRGSGTSMSAAVASGAAALLLQADPSLTPDEVKGHFMASAADISETDPFAAGQGSIDLPAAVGSEAPAANSQLPSLPAGGAVAPPKSPFSGDSKVSFVWHGDGPGPDRWLARGWAARGWAGAAWSARGWAGSEWAGREWAARGWAARGWAGSDWSARGWTSLTWATTEWR